MGNSTERYQLYRRGTTYWMRFSIKEQGQLRFSLETKDEVEARERAERKYQHALWSAEQGILSGKTSFDKVARQYVEHITEVGKTNPKKAGIAKAEKAIIDRYLIPYFGKATVTSITEPKLYSYLEWRKVYWTTGPGSKINFVEYDLANGKKGRRKVKHEEPHPNTLRREASALRAVFNHAVRLGYLKRGDVPELRLEASKKNKRPAFTKKEVNLLLNAALNRLEEASMGGSVQPKLRHERAVLFAFISIAVLTGMRPTELYNLNWGHLVGVEDERAKPLEAGRIRIAAYGKGMAPRELVPRPGVISAFELLWLAFEGMHGRRPESDDPVFTNFEGERLGSIKRSLNNLLAETGLKVDAFGRARSAYSFRHYYATEQLQKGIDIYSLAINMRTSVRMIEMYYSDVIPEDMARKLEGAF